MKEHKRDTRLEDFNILSQDQCLNVYHITLLLSIFKLAYLQGHNETNSINVSRSKLIYHSHIMSVPTYHKYFKQLQIYLYKIKTRI